MARPRGRGGRAAHHDPDRARDERHPEARGAPVDLALRPVVGGDELRVRRRPVLRAGAGVRAGAERRGARRRQPGRLAALQPERPDLPVRAAEPRPLAAGAEDDRGLGGRAPLPRDPGRGGRLGLRRHDDAVPGAARPAAHAVATASRIPQVVDQLAANNANAGGGFYSQGGQFYYVRGLGLVRNLDDIGNVVLSAHDGIPVHVHDVAKVADRPRGAPRPVRLHEAGRGRRGRDPDARGRAGAGGAQARAAGHEEPERARAAARREGGARSTTGPISSPRPRRPSSATCSGACCSCWSCWACCSSASARP